MSCSSTPATPNSASIGRTEESRSPFAYFWDRADEGYESARKAITTPSPRSQLSSPVSQVRSSPEVVAIFKRVFHGIYYVSPEKQALLDKVSKLETMTDAEKIEILNDYPLLSELNENFILELFKSLKVPVHVAHIFQFIRSDKNIKEMFFFCWKNQLIRTLSSLCLHVEPSPELRNFIKDELKSAMTPVNLKMLADLVPYFKGEMVEYVFNLLGELTPEQHQFPETSLLKKDFFFGSNALKFLSAAGYGASLGNLILAFDFYWSFSPQLSKQQLKDFEQICHKIYLQDDRYIDFFVRNFLVSNQNSLPSTLAYAMDCLHPETVGLIDDRVKEMVKARGDSETTAKEFLKTAHVKSLMLWRHTFDENLGRFTWLHKGTQIGKDGAYDADRALEIGLVLNKNAPGKITFNTGRLCILLDGGVCSAMMMRTLRLYREARAQSENPTEAIKSLAQGIRTASEEFRTIQAVYNTIEKTTLPADFKRAKIEALLKYENPDLSVMSAFPEIDLDVEGANAQVFSQYNNLTDGLYVVRALSPLEAKDEYFEGDRELAKGEVYGHSTFLIKEKGEAFYYDPAIGFLKFDQPAAQLHMALAWENLRWGVHRTRFYQVV